MPDDLCSENQVCEYIPVDILLLRNKSFFYQWFRVGSVYWLKKDEYGNRSVSHHRVEEYCKRLMLLWG